MKVWNNLLWSLLAASFLFTGCVTRGENFSSDTIWLDKNKPHQEEVRKIMGPPLKVGSSDGVPTWTYGYYKHQLFGDSLIKELKIYWDSQNKVKSFSFSSSFPEDGAGTKQ